MAKAQSEETVTVVSYNRPLTRNAAKDLKPYGIVKETKVNDYGRWTVVEVENKPDDKVLEKHELRAEIEPECVYETDHGETVEIFEDSVEVDGMVQGLTPDEAINHAESNEWEKVN